MSAISLHPTPLMLVWMPKRMLVISNLSLKRGTHIVGTARASHDRTLEEITRFERVAVGGSRRVGKG